MALFDQLVESIGPVIGGILSERGNSRAAGNFDRIAQETLAQSNPFGPERSQYARLLSQQVNTPEGIMAIPGIKGALNKATDVSMRQAARGGGTRTGTGQQALFNDYADKIMELYFQNANLLGNLAGANMSPDTRTAFLAQQEAANARRNQGGSVFDGISQGLDILKGAQKLFGGGSGLGTAAGASNLFGAGVNPFSDLAAGAFAPVQGGGGLVDFTAGGLFDFGAGSGGSLFGGGGSIFDSISSGFNSIGSSLFGGGGGGFGGGPLSFFSDKLTGFGNFLNQGIGLPSFNSLGSGIGSFLGSSAAAAIPLGLISAAMMFPDAQNRDVFGRPYGGGQVPAFNRDGSRGAWKIYTPGNVDPTSIGLTGLSPFTGEPGDGNVPWLEHGIGYNNYAGDEFLYVPEVDQVGGSLGSFIPGQMIEGQFRQTGGGDTPQIRNALASFGTTVNPDAM